MTPLLYLHLWLKIANNGDYFVYRSYVSMKADFPDIWTGKTMSSKDTFHTQIIQWPSGIKKIGE